MTYYHDHKVVANDDWFKAFSGQMILINGSVATNDYDTKGHDLDFQVIGQSKDTVQFNTEHGVVVWNGETGQFRYAADANYVGYDYFEYKAYDDKGHYDTAKVVFKIEKYEPDVVDAKDDYYKIKEGKKVEGNLLHNDTDSKGHDLDIVWVSDVKGGELKIDYETGAFKFKADKDRDHKDDKVYFEYKVSDGKGNYDTAKVVIHVEDKGGKHDHDWKDDYQHKPHWDLIS
jgi:hypothetical protein